jgi:hypothetical protein
MRVVKSIVWALISIVAFLCASWATGALYYDFPIVAARALIAIVFAVVLLVAVIFARGKVLKVAVVFGSFILVLLWWLALKPSNDHPWTPDVAQTAWAEINGDEVTIHNIRDCDYRTETDFTTRWETRTVRLSQITDLDLSIMYWGSPWMAHPIISFRFADALPLCFSVEARKSIGQEYSILRSIYRQYTLVYIVADERDSIRVRTNYRPGEDVYLYRTQASPENARKRFLEYLNAVNTLHVHPRWYNAITANCTTSIRDQRPTDQRMPWDWRILVNGKADELLYERHLIATAGLPFIELKRRCHINERARSADQDPDFSRRVREGIPGFD